MNLTNAIEKVKNQKTRFQEQLRIGFCNLASVSLLPDAIRIFHETFPNVQIKIVSRDLGSLCAMYESGSLDVFLGMRSSMKKNSSDSCEKLYEGRIVVVVSDKHPLFEKDLISFKELQRETVYIQEHSQIPTSMIKTVELLRKKCPEIAFTYCRDINEIYILILAGMGVAIVPQYSIQQSEKCRHIRLEEELKEAGDIDYYAMWKKDSKKYIKNFVYILKDTYQNH